MMITSIAIADLRIDLQTVMTPDIPDNFKAFITEAEDQADCCAVLEPVKDLQIREGRKAGGTYDMDVIKSVCNGADDPDVVKSVCNSADDPDVVKSVCNIANDPDDGQNTGVMPDDPDTGRYFRDDFYRYYHLANKKDYYAVGDPMADGSRTVVRYLDTANIKNLNQCFHMTGWEQMMIAHDRMILHSSCIETRYGGILFTGASGIGKSTQADLWIQYRQAKLVNGDRTILHRQNEPVNGDRTEKWKGYGAPFAGSSRCYRNVCVTVRAIVVLEQGAGNRIRRLSGIEAFKAIYAGTTIYTWNQDFVENVVDMVNALVSDVPVYLLSCTPDEGAVFKLEEALKEE